MQFQKFLVFSTALLLGVTSAPLSQIGNLIFLRKKHLLKFALGKSAVAADQAYTFHVSSDEVGKPILSNSVTAAHQKRGGPMSKAA